MTREPVGKPPGSRVLRDVREGMAVYDRTDVRLGTVGRVYLGTASEQALDRGGGPATAPDPRAGQSAFPDDVVAGIFGPEAMPEEVRERLIRHGFIKIDGAGLFASDRYAMPEHVEGVAGDRVRLRVAASQLIDTA